MKVRKLYLIRHVESLKNIRDEHGGLGDSLSNEGKEQCKKICLLLKNEKLERKTTTLFWSSNPQVSETAKIIIKKNFYKSICDDRLRGINLGVLSGLSRAEALEKFPEPAKKLEKWRQNKLKINKLNIPNAENVLEFYKRVKSLIEDRIISSMTPYIVIIGTRSTMIMIVNLFLLGEKFNFNDYKNYDFDCGSITKFIFQKGKAKLEYLNITDFLNNKTHLSNKKINRAI